MNRLARWVFFDKRYEQADLPQKVRRLERLFVMAAVLSLITGGFTIVLTGHGMYMSGVLLDRHTDLPAIDLSNLTAQEAAVVQAIIDDLDPLYLRGHESITVTHDVEAAYQGTLHRTYRGDGFILLGFNYKGRIYVQYDTDVEDMRRTLCHELLHTYHKGGETTHDIIRDLEAKDVCYT